MNSHQGLFRRESVLAIWSPAFVHGYCSEDFDVIARRDGCEDLPCVIHTNRQNEAPFQVFGPCPHGAGVACEKRPRIGWLHGVLP